MEKLADIPLSSQLKMTTGNTAQIVGYYDVGDEKR